MIAKVDKATCISCGSCAKLCPEVFEIGVGDKAYVKVEKVPVINEFNAKKAEKNCPVEAIKTC
ncbi:ferredoxin [Clostridium senegalense]|uniref:ferredoxin n=1 Tax=Clostridium senegalense TaxID=1465809 RepID=UPI001C100137|nr:ferredoxin [Clostridium senegalense]MBU5227535.1 ferredoxin [Clostridium senegalense]